MTFLLTAASAALIVFAFPPWNIHPLIWIALLPWFAALERTRTQRQAFVQGVWLSIGMSLGGFYWVKHVLEHYAGLPAWVGALGLAIFSVFGQPQFPLFALVWRKTRTSGPVALGGLSGTRALGAAVLVALTYTAIDFHVFKLFVDTFGHSQYVARHLRQAADLGGAALLTFAIFLFNEALYGLIKALRARKEPSIWPAFRQAGAPMLTAVVLVGSLWIYGRGRLAEVTEAQAHPLKTVQAAVIQANIGDFEKIASERGVGGAADKILETFFTLSDQALTHVPRPQILVWPETSYPSTFRTPGNAEEMNRDRRVENFVATRKVQLLFGGYDRFDGKDFNAFFFLSPPGAPGVAGSDDLQTYRKNVLLMFGEYIPGAEHIDWFKTAFPQVGNFGRGVGPSVLPVQLGSADGTATIGSVQIAPIICYEALFPNYLIEGARKGAEMILNITNDSWFGESGEPILHLSLTTFRGIETRLPQLRATNTGISALVMPDGEITQPTALSKPEILHASVPVIKPIPTLMLAWGDWFGRAALGLALAGWAILIALKRRRAAG